MAAKTQTCDPPRIRQPVRRADDPQGTPLYHAEKRFIAEPPPAEMKFSSGKEAQDWIAALFRSKEFAAAYPQAAEKLAADPPKVKTNKNKKKIGWASAEMNMIALSLVSDEAGLTLPTVIHELSHIVADNMDESSLSLPAHGERFTAAYLDMVALTLGDNASACLRRDFEQNGLEIGRQSVRLAGAGMLTTGRLPKPTGQPRTEQSVQQAKIRRLAEKVDKHWKEIQAKASGPEEIKFSVLHNRSFFSKCAEEGVRLPAEIAAMLADPAMSYRSFASKPGESAGNNHQRCGRPLPIARVPCGLRKNHPGRCSRY